MTESPSEVKGTSHDASPLEVKAKRLLLVVTNNSNYALKQTLSDWSKDKPRTRDLSAYNPVRHNTGTLELDETEYTLSLANWLKGRNYDDLKVFRIAENLWDDIF